MKASSLALPLLLLSSPALHASAAEATCPPGFDPARDPSGAASEIALLDAIASLGDHVASTAAYDALAIDAARAQFAANAAKLTFNRTTIEVALDLVDLYETQRGPLFVSTATDGGFDRTWLAAPDGQHDGRELERAMLTVQQATLDEVYHGSLWHSRHRSDPRDRTYAPIVAECADVLDGRKWNTSDYFPGAVDPPSDPTAVHDVIVDATFATRWGRRVAFSDDFNDDDTNNAEGNNFNRKIRPLGGLYLAPGATAVVTVPSALVGAGFTVQVGGNSIDNFNKNWHLRMDRITTTYPIESTVVHVANPLGGGLYLRIPYQASAGVVTVSVTGGVVKSPRFALTSLEQTTEIDWNAGRTNPGPWVDFESDVFLMTVPRMWVYNYDYGHVIALLTNYTNIMNGITELVGVPPDRRNNYVGYITGDRHIRYGGYGIGYPQCNNIVPANANGPQLSGFWGSEGVANFWMVVNPILDGGATFHEMGHEEYGGDMKSFYRGETESVVHVLYTYARNEVYGDDIDVAFSDSINPKLQCMGTSASVGCTSYDQNVNRVPVMSVDDAAVDWMVRENFRNGLEMDYSRTEANEIQYQHRGHAKYADMARLFGWQFMKDFHLQESEDVEAGAPSTPCPNLEGSDDRTFRLSLKAGVDLMPLVHFWGIQPINELAMSECMSQNDLCRSLDIKAQLERYATLVPVTQEAFTDHYDAIWPGKRGTSGCDNANFGCGWYEMWYGQWTETLAAQTVTAVQDIIARYYTVSTPAPTSAPTSAPIPAPTPAPCEDTGSANFCQRKLDRGQCPHDSCKKTCGRCPSRRLSVTLCPVPSPPTLSPTRSPTTSPIEAPPPGTPSPTSSPTRSPASSPGATPQCGDFSPKPSCRDALDGNSCEWRKGSCGPIGGRRRLRGLNVFDLPHMAAERANMNGARNKWNKNPPKRYSFELEYVYNAPKFMRGPFGVEVDNGKIVSVVETESGEAANYAYTPAIPTLEDIFGVIERKLDSATYVKVDYDDQSGLPRRMFYNEDSDDYEDGAVHMMVRNVVVQKK